MDRQSYSWTCSVCSATWVLQSMGAIDPSQDSYSAREQVGSVIGYPNCVNETYGLMSADCLIQAFSQYGLNTHQAWVTFDQAYAIMHETTGVINPLGMYHFMAMRSVSGDQLWVANSAPGYMGVWDTLSRGQFNNLGPVQVIYVD